MFYCADKHPFYQLCGLCIYVVHKKPPFSLIRREALFIIGV